MNRIQIKIEDKDLHESKKKEKGNELQYIREELLAKFNEKEKKTFSAIQVWTEIISVIKGSRISLFNKNMDDFQERNILTEAKEWFFL